MLFATKSLLACSAVIALGRVAAWPIKTIDKSNKGQNCECHARHVYQPVCVVLGTFTTCLCGRAVYLVYSFASRRNEASPSTYCSVWRGSRVFFKFHRAHHWYYTAGTYMHAMMLAVLRKAAQKHDSAVSGQQHTAVVQAAYEWIVMLRTDRVHLSIGCLCTPDTALPPVHRTQRIPGEWPVLL